MSLAETAEINGVMYEKMHLRVTAKGHFFRIDSYIRMRMGNISRNQIQKAIDEGRVLLNGKIPHSSTKLNFQDEIIFYSPLPSPRYIPNALNLEILYEDGHIIAVHKPSGMSMHPGPGHKGDTLADALVHYQISQGASENVGPGAVHRLDLPTSGIVLVGKNIQMQTDLGSQFFERTIQKEYLALAWGVAPEEGFIDAPIGRCPGDKYRLMVDFQEEKPAQTFFEKIQQFPEFSLLRVLPKTGRTHQIRVHLCYIGYPILGDPLYGKQNFHIFQNRLPNLSPETRLCLHAHKITFNHPYTQKEMTLSAPLPEDFQKIIQNIEKWKLENF